MKQYIDANRWPHVVKTPQARFQGLRARDVTQRLEDLLRAQGISLSPADTPHMVVGDGQLIDRIVADGWLGVAEGYMAGEWDAEPLEEVLSAVLSQPLEQPSRHMLGTLLARNPRDYGSVMAGEVPDSLVEIYAGVARTTGAALFSSASRVTSTETVDVSIGSGRKHTAKWPIDVTHFGPPHDVERQDLDDAQLRRIESMLDEAGVRAGDKVLELPSSGGQLAIQAALRGASVDVLTSDIDHADAVDARVRAAGVAGAVRVELIDGPIPSPRQWSGSYDAIFTVERMETLGAGGLRHFLRAIDRMLRRGGIAVAQAVVTCDNPEPTTDESLDVMRAYVWPTLHYPTVAQVREVAGRHTDLRVIAETHMGEHWAATLPLWRANFAARERQAAAAGFDSVFRRLWDYQLALHQALVGTGQLDCVQFVLTPR